MTTSPNENPLRKIALLVSVLGTDDADALLDGMPEEVAAQVRAEVMELVQVDPRKQLGVIAEFMAKAKPEESANQFASLADAASGPGNDLAGAVPYGRYLTAEEDDSDHTATPPDPLPRAGAPFGSLAAISDDQLADVLRHEHPQAAAVVLAHLAPQRSAELIALLPPRQQAEVIRRIVDLQHVDADLLRELDRGFAELIGVPMPNSPQLNGRQAMRDILSAAAGEGRAAILKNLRHRDAALAGVIAERREAEAPKISVAVETIADISLPIEQDAFPHPTPAHLEFDDFVDLDDATLGRVLQRGGGRLLLLALAGASEALIQRVYQQLPAREATLLQRQIEQQGPISLRDVAEAQRRIARLAAEMALQGLIDLPPQRRFAVAA